MPALALLLRGLLGNLYALYLATVAYRITTKLIGIAAMASAYLVFVLVFNAFIEPWIDSAMQTSYGQVLGLAFPPVAGTVLFGFVALWVALIAKRYYTSVIKLGAS